MAIDKVYNLIILDESGSMDSIKKATISGFNELVQTIKGIEKQFPEQQHFISFVTFNSAGIKTHLKKQAVSMLSEIDARSYQPSGGTPLYDAIGLSVTKLRLDLAAQENANVLVTILTDGEENSSREFNGQQIKTLIEEQKVSGWTFTYIGANQDVEKVAASMSITNTMQFLADDRGVNEMFQKERSSRIYYSQKIRNKEDKLDNFYMDDEDSKKDKKA